MNLIKTNKELEALEVYNLTMNPEAESMKNLKGSIIEVKNWAIYETEDKDDKPITIMSIESPDGELCATNSKTFREEFLKTWELMEQMGSVVKSVKVITGTSKNNREFISCKLERIEGVK